jgi:hypothetical protein
MSLDDSLQVDDALDALGPLEQKALANIRNFGQDASTVDHLVIDGGHDVGRLAIAYSRGALRLGVIEKVGRRNVEFLYTTDAALKEAHDTFDLYASRLATKSWLQGAQQAGESHDFYVREANPLTRLYPDTTHALSPSQKAAHDAILLLTREQYVTDILAKEEERIRTQATKPWTAFLYFTRKSVPFAKAFILKP